jgi:hypothetical protein
VSVSRSQQIGCLTVGLLRGLKAGHDRERGFPDAMLWAEAMQAAVNTLVAAVLMDDKLAPIRPLLSWRIEGEPAPPHCAHCRVTLTFTPRAEPLPDCWKHPGLPCVGECQYSLGPGVCLNDLERVP